jgi:hypothetical protein
MFKKYISISAAVFLLIIIILAFFYLRRKQPYDANEPMNAVMGDAALVVQVNQPELLMELLSRKVSFASALSDFEFWQAIQAVLAWTDSSAIMKQPAAKVFLQRPFTFSLHPDTAEAVSWLLNLSVKNPSEALQLSNAVEVAMGRFVSFNGSVYKWQSTGDLPLDLYCCFQNGILSVSPSAAIVERVRKATSAECIVADASFERIRKTSLNEQPVSVYFNFRKLSSVSRQLYSGVSEDQWTAWAELDMDIRKSSVYLNGFSFSPTDSLFSSLFKGVEPMRSNVADVIPSSAKMLMSYNMSSRFKDNLVGFKFSDGYSKLANEFLKRHGVSFPQMFLPLIDCEAALAYIVSEPAGQYHKLLVFSTPGQTEAMAVLQKMMTDNKRSASETFWISLDDDTRFPVYEMPEATVMRNYFQVLFPEVPSVYFSFYQNYMVFADSRDAIREFLYANVLKKNLASHPYYSSFVENFGFDDNFFLFVEIPHIFNLIKGHLNKNNFPNEAQNKALTGFYGVGLQLSQTTDLLYTTIFANYAPYRDKEPRTIWQSRLDTIILGKPVLVDNHVSGDKEVMVQDAKNNLYLINNMGRILWKRPLEEPIMSEIYQIDYYKNNKLQYLFNTATRLYLLDRNGNYVARYPISLPALATNGLAVFDYLNDKDYRIFVALADDRIYLYDKTGNRNPGWDAPKSEGIVTLPLQHFVSQGRDYLVYSDQFRNYITDRRGNVRVTPDRSFVRNATSLFYLEGEDQGSPFLTTTTTRGELVHVALPSGKTSLTSYHEELEPHYFTWISLPNGHSRYVYVTENRFQLFDEKGNLAASRIFEEPVLINVDLYQFSSSDIKFGLVEQHGGHIHLLNLDGSEYEGFPLKGISRFSIGFLKSSYRFNLLTGGENDYLYNYRVE